MTPSPQKAALITGGSRGIGLGIAQALAADGWRLAINGLRSEADVAVPLAALREKSPQVVYCQGDVSNAADRAACLDQVRTAFGSLHLLVNNAGITSPDRFDMLRAGEESFDKVFNVNLKGPYFLTQAAANWMVEQRAADPAFDGCIVNISSISAEWASTTRGDYCMARAGTSMATKLWAVRLAEYGIRVYEVRPGVIATDMTAGATEKYDRLIADGLTLQRRWGQPEDVGRAVAALARDEFPYATGQVVKIDGGMTVGRL